mgnify:CR=1 FL=1
MDQNKIIESLLKRYQSNQLTLDEAVTLKEWMCRMDDDEIEQHLSQLWDTYEPSGKAPQETRIQIARNLKQTLLPQPQTISNSFKQQVWRSVAAVFFCLLAGTSLYLYIDREEIQKTLASEYLVQVGKGEKATVTLPDGTKVYLNAQSALSYPAAFGQQERKVQFTGEAYFEVARDEKKPFIVDNPAISVKVLGTEFNFYATADDEWFETTLVKGKVEVTLKMPTPRKEILDPNQKIRYNKLTGAWNITDADVWEDTAWKRGDMVFRSKNFEEVVKQLEAYYGVTISIEGNCPNNLFTGTFHENNVNAILLNLQQHYDFKYTKNGNEINLKLNY